MYLASLLEKIGPIRKRARRCHLAGMLCLVLLPLSALLGEETELTFANLHYVTPTDDFLGVEVSFFALNELYDRVGHARVEAFSVEIIDDEWIFIPRGIWPLELTWEDVVPASSEGFFEPRYSMIRLGLPAENPRPYEHSLLVVTISMDEREIREERLFPNVWEVPEEAQASLVDMGDGNMTPGLRLEQLTVLMPDLDPDPDQEPSANPEPLGQSSGEGGLISAGATVNAGTHIMIHAHPQMAKP